MDAHPTFCYQKLGHKLTCVNIDVAMAQNYQPLKLMVFLLNMIISVGHWYHKFEPNPYVVWMCLDAATMDLHARTALSRLLQRNTRSGRIWTKL